MSGSRLHKSYPQSLQCRRCRSNEICAVFDINFSCDKSVPHWEFSAAPGSSVPLLKVLQLLVEGVCFLEGHSEILGNFSTTRIWKKQNKKATEARQRLRWQHSLCECENRETGGHESYMFWSSFSALTIFNKGLFCSRDSSFQFSLSHSSEISEKKTQGRQIVNQRVCSQPSRSDGWIRNWKQT